MLEALARQICADLRASDSMMTHEDDFGFRVERVGPFGKAAQRKQLCAFHVCHLMLRGFTHVYDLNIIAARHALFQLSGRDRPVLIRLSRLTKDSRHKVSVRYLSAQVMEARGYHLRGGRASAGRASDGRSKRIRNISDGENIF